MAKMKGFKVYCNIRQIWRPVIFYISKINQKITTQKQFQEVIAQTVTYCERGTSENLLFAQLD